MLKVRLLSRVVIAGPDHLGAGKADKNVHATHSGYSVILDQFMPDGVLLTGFTREKDADLAINIIREQKIFDENDTDWDRIVTKYLAIDGHDGLMQIVGSHFQW